MELSLAKEKVAGAVMCLEKATRLLEGFGDLHTLLDDGARLAKFAQLDQTPGERSTRPHGGIRGAAEEGAGQVALEQCHGLCQHDGGAAVVTHSAQDHAQIETNIDQRNGVSNGLCQ